MPELARPLTLTRSSTNPREPAISRTSTKTWGIFRLRTDHDIEDQDWWVASIAIPLLAATLAPLANVLSIAALVSTWRVNLEGPHGHVLPPLAGSEIPDPSGVYGVNLASLITGYVGNIFLLMNFTNRIRYIIALPVTIILWYISTALLIGIQVSLNKYHPPQPPYQVYSQAFWYGVIAAVLYLVCSMILMVNMVGYFLGHYPQQFNLTDSQRTLILQTFLFFIWLAGGAGVYSKLETEYGVVGWSFSDALYFCDVTILTVGFGDLVPTENVGRALLIPYSIVGIIMLGLMVASITKFAREIGQTNIIRARANRQRLHTLERSSRRQQEFVEPEWNRMSADQIRKSISRAPDEELFSKPPGEPTINFAASKIQPRHQHPVMKSLRRTGTMALHAMQGKGGNAKGKSRRNSVGLLREEKDRFDAMRKIQHDNAKFKRWSALCLSSAVLFILWFLGAVVFWQVEGPAQDLSYFQAIYFCFVSLVTIGYGDFAPVTNAGRPFFVVWSLLAIPSITILISNMADTVVASFVKATERLASFTLLPEKGIWRNYLERHPRLLGTIQNYKSHKAAEKRVAAGFEAGPPVDNPAAPQEYEMYQTKTIDELARQRDMPPSEHELAHSLSLAIRKTAQDFRKEPDKRYGYEEWVEFTQLIRFTKAPRLEDEEDSDDEGLIEWDWIGEDSPMMTDKTEPEWLLDRLCESMGRYVKRQRRTNHRKKDAIPENDWYRFNPETKDEGNSGTHNSGQSEGESGKNSNSSSMWSSRRSRSRRRSRRSRSRDL